MELETGQLDPMPNWVGLYVYFYFEQDGEYMDCLIVFDLTIISEDSFTDISEDEVSEDSEDEDQQGEEKAAITDGDEFFLLEDWPEEPDVITCAGTSSSKNWIYYFPDKVDRKSDVRFWNA